MGENVKVSVIIPVYNAEKYLRQCLDSVVNQTLREIEIICVDDGSTDGSLSILREYEARDTRVKVLTQTNQYAGVARNNGMSVASGKYYIFWDADDFFEPDALALMYARSEEFQADICICGATEYNVVTKKENTMKWLLHCPNVVEPFNRKCVKDIYAITSPAPWNKLFSSKFVKDNNLLFQDVQRVNDLYFVFSALALADSIITVNKPLIHYRTDDGSNLQAHMETTPIAACEAIMDVKNALKRCDGIWEQVGWSLCNFALYNIQYNLNLIADSDDGKTKLLCAVANTYWDELEISAHERRWFKDPQLFDRVTRQIKELRGSTDYSVSVIIPVYNVEKYLRECLDSVVKQTRKDIEIICVNDGSTDGSLEILQEYAEKDRRIKVISQENKGLSGARNTGVRYARGEYIYFLDSDDYIELDAMEYLYQQAKSANLDVLYFDGKSFYETPEVRAQCERVDCCYRPQEFGDIYSGEQLHALMRKNSAFRPMAVMQFTRRGFYLEKNLSFYEGILHEDVLFSVQCMLKAQRVSHRKKALYHYRRRAGAITTAISTFERVYGKVVVVCELYKICRFGAYAEATKKMLLNYINYQVSVSKEEWERISEEERAKSAAYPQYSIPEMLTKYDGSLGSVLLLLERNVCHPKWDNLIISLTSYPARIKTVHKTIETLLNQTLKADKVILWLASCQFPNGEADLPDELLQCRERGLEIRWCDEDLRPHKKYFYAMQEFPDDIIITVDDDLLYRKDLVEILYKSYLRYPHAVSAMRTHLIAFEENGEIAPYQRWTKEYPHLLGIPSMQLCATGVGGILYPPHCMYKDLFRMDLVKELCINADDLWLKAMQVLAGTPVVLAAPHTKLQYVPNTQETALWNTNGPLGQNDVQLSNILGYYETVEIPAKQFITASIQSDAKWVELATKPDNRPTQSKQNAAKNQSNEAALIRASWSYRIGRFITWPYRMVRGFFRCYREHGWSYTWRRVLVHLCPSKYVYLARKVVWCYRDHGFRYTWYKILEKLHLMKY